MIGIIVAMSAEFRLVETLLTDRREIVFRSLRFVEGKIGGKEAIVLQCGIGKVCAAVGTSELIRRFAPDYIVNTGVAGGIDSVLQVMDIVVGKEIVYHDVWCGEGNEKGQVQGLPARFAVDSRLYELALSLDCQTTLRGGLICSGDCFITDRPTLESIKKEFPEGLAVDMESGAIAQVCYLYGTPFLSFRIISDTPGQVENHAVQYQDFWTAAPETSFSALKLLIEKI